MLERTSSCLELASQLLLRQSDLPIRTSRALGPGFWRNAADQLPLHLPSWWPVEITNDSPYIPISPLPTSDGHSMRTGRHPLRLPPNPKFSRSYTRALALSQAGQATELSDHSLSRPSRNAFLGHHDQVPFQTLEANLEFYSHAQNQPTDTVLENINSLFLKIPNQADYATRFLQVFSRSSNNHHLASALGAFDLISSHNRSQKDYSRAVQTAIKLTKYRKAAFINKEATSRRRNQDCSALLLVYSVSNQLWSLAAQVWSDSFQVRTPPYHEPELRREIARQTDLQQKLPSALLELGKSLSPSDPDPMIWKIHGVLISLASTFQHLLVGSSTLMGSINPKGLQDILEIYSSSTQVHRTAIDTLHKSKRRSDRGPLAMLVYRHLRSSHPGYVPTAALLGKLIVMHCEDSAPADILISLLHEFAAHHGTPDRLAYQKIISALARQGEVTSVQSVFLDLCRTHGRPTEPVYYSPLIYVYARVADHEGAQSVFSMMENTGIERNTYSWNILIHAYVRAGLPERALQLFQSMMAEQVAPDQHTFGTLMSIHSASGDIDQVMQVVELAQQYNLQASYEMVAGVVHSYCLNDRIDDAIELAVVSTKTQYPGTPVKMWNHILKYYAFRAQPERVAQIRDQMADLGVSPDDMSYAAFMTALIVVGKTEQAAKILRSLDIEQGFVASRFHYTIILQGFLLEENRDMAQVICSEMAQRFVDIGPSARLAIQRMRGQLSLEAGPSASVNAVSDYVADFLIATNMADRATKEPQRGIGRRKNVDAFPSAFVEDLLKLLIIKGRFRQAGSLIDRFQSLADASHLGMNPSNAETIQLLTSRIAILKSTKDWISIEEAWERIFNVAIRIGQSVTVSTPGDGDLPTLETPPPVSVPTLSTDSDTTAITEAHPETPQSLDAGKPKILFSQRFILKDAITRYLSALDEQKLYNKAANTVKVLEAWGFALTSKNMNFYIQILTHSENLEHNILAFQLFEEKLLANTPPWKALVRGKWKATDSSKRDTDVSLHDFLDRKVVEKQNPGLLMPTYFTCVHLAMLLREYQQIAERGAGNTVPLLSVSKAAPGTFDFIRRIPHIPDRIQSVLLRDRKLIRGDRLKLTAQMRKVDRSGVLESRSLVDHVPADVADSLDEEFTLPSPNADTAVSPLDLSNTASLDIRDDDIEDLVDQLADSSRQDSVSDTSAQIVAQGERYEGKINRSYSYLDREGRFETVEERHERIKNQETKLVKVVQAMESDVKEKRVMSDMHFGRPTLKAPRKDMQGLIKNFRETRLNNGRLYNLSLQHIEFKALATRRAQAKQIAAIGNADGSPASSNIVARKPIPSSRAQVSKSHSMGTFLGAPPGPYGKRALRHAKDPRLPRDVKLVAKLEDMNPLPQVLLKGFSKNREERHRQSFRNKVRMEWFARRAQEDLERLKAEELEAISHQGLLYKTLDQEVELNRARAEAAKVNQHELLQAQRLEEQKLANERIMNVYLPERYRREKQEAKMLAELVDESRNDDDVRGKKK
ncbi:hypothetical protein LTR84_002225 [Exophiala bonariae]|uniref:Uncharacterized protein n=1 Tax=Exophiala bonariae TaxID=1690606 RepID=A0AAV9NAQ6_9EURO|nr:hypothetical protein LTR84_002225 [Exophiala bonariae]